MQVNCAAHLLHNCAMRVRAHFKNIDEVIGRIKAAKLKNKDRKKDFQDAGLPFPPDPIITRWTTWLIAALYYSENLPPSCSSNCQKLDKCRPLSQQSKRYQCGRFGVGLR